MQDTNRVMIEMLRRLHLPMKTTSAYGVLEIEITVEPEPADVLLTVEIRGDAA